MTTKHFYNWQDFEQFGRKQPHGTKYFVRRVSPEGLDVLITPPDEKQPTMKIFTTRDGTHIDLGVVFSISNLLFDWRSDYGVHSYESDWYVMLGVKGKEQPLKFSLGCGPNVLRTDDYDCVQEKRRKSDLNARSEYTRLIEGWACKPE